MLMPYSLLLVQYFLGVNWSRPSGNTAGRDDVPEPPLVKRAEIVGSDCETPLGGTEPAPRGHVRTHTEANRPFA